MKPPIDLGPGIAADVTIVDNLVYVAFGFPSVGEIGKPDYVPMGLELVTLTLDGTVIARRTLPLGFDQSFPRFDDAWLVYRQDESVGYRAAAWNLLTGQSWFYTAAGGTFGLTVNAALGLCAYEWKTADTPWTVWLGHLETGKARESDLRGAPDGLDTIISPNSVSLRKDTRGDVAGIWYPVRADNLTVGELRDSTIRPNGGIGVQLAGDVLRAALLGENTPTPRCAAAGGRYAIVCWGQTVRLLLASEADLRALPPVALVPDPVDQPNNPPTKEDPPTNEPRPVHPGKEVMPKTKDEVRAVIDRIFKFYVSQEGLQRTTPPIDYPGADPAFWDWVALGLAQSPEEVERQIRNHVGGEWQRKHPHENPR